MCRPKNQLFASCGEVTSELRRGAHRGRRLKRRSTAARGAASDNDAVVEHRASNICVDINPIYVIIILYPAQSRASSIATPDDGAGCGRRQCVPPMERREAQGPSHGPVRPGIPTALKRLGSRKHDAQAGLANRPKGADRKAPEAPPGAPFPSLEGKRKTGTKGPPRGPKSKPRDSEALAD